MFGRVRHLCLTGLFAALIASCTDRGPPGPPGPPVPASSPFVNADEKKPNEKKYPAVLTIWDTLSKLTPKSVSVPKEIKPLIGKTQKIGGFMITNEFIQGNVYEFLLTPMAGGCIHVPPPPPNWVIHATVPKDKAVFFSFAPIVATGKLTVPSEKKYRRYYSYELTVDSVEPFHP